MPELKIDVVSAADLTGTNAMAKALDDLAARDGRVSASQTTVAQTGNQAAAATTRLGQAAAATPSAPLQNLAAAAAQVQTNAQAATQSLTSLSQQSSSFLSNIQTGFGVGIGASFGSKIVEGVEAIGHQFTEAMHRGIEYNAEMETRAIGLAAKLRSVEPEKFGTFEAARTQGVQTMDLLRERASALGLEFGGLAETFNVVLPSLVEAGVTKTKDQVDVLIRLSQIAQSGGVARAMATRDILATLSGRRNKLGTEMEALGVTPTGIAQAKQDGSLRDLIMNNTKGFGEADEARANSYQGKLAAVTNELHRLEGELASPVFERLKDLLGSAKDGSENPVATGYARGIGKILAGWMADLEEVPSSIESFWNRHPWLKSLNNAISAPERHFFGGAKDTIEDSIGDARKEAAAKGQKLAPVTDDDASDAARRATRDREAEEKYQASPRAQTTRDHLATNKEAEELDNLNEKVSAHIRQLTHEYPQASQAWRKGKAEEEVAAEHFAGSMEKLNAAIDKAAGKTETLDQVRTKLIGLHREFSAALEDSTRDKLTPDQIYTGNPATNGTLEIVRALPELTAQERTQKEALLKIVLELIQAEEKRATLVQKEGKEVPRIGREAVAVGKDAGQVGADADAAFKEKKQHDDLVADLNSELAILRAQAAGNDDLAASLLKQRELQKDIRDLMDHNLSLEEATAKATERQNLAQQAKDAQFKKDHPPGGDNSGPWLAFRPGETPEQYHARTGGYDTRAKDTDPSGGLHSGSLNDARPDTPFYKDRSRSPSSTAAADLADAPSAGAALAGAPSARDILDAAGPFRFPDDPANRTSFAGLAGFDGWNPQGTTAAAALGPIADRINPPAQAGGKGDTAAPGGGAGAGGGAGGDNGLAAAAKKTATSAGGAKDAAGQMAGEMQQAASSMNDAAGKLDGLKTTLSNLATDVGNLKNAVSNLQTSVGNLTSGH